MKFQDLYEKGLDRKVNPAVSASDLSDETVMTEIIEYVFTEEIVCNLFKVLNNIHVNQGSHVGIWINGYYGSGKSHFLKYVSYCLAGKKDYRDLAFMRLEEAVREILVKSKNLSKLEDEGVSLSELKSLKDWYVNKADIEMVLFNIGDVHDANGSRDTVFTSIFWNQFNAQRGYNSFNLAMAQYLEKALDDDGKFQEFKDYVKSKGYDWNLHISRFAAGKLSLALQMAKEVDPSLDIEAIRPRIINNDVNISVEAFAKELKEYIDRKQNRNFRLLFLVDEVSQFIGQHDDVLLQLQSLVKRVDEVCESKVWIACTAQQTLDEVVKNVGHSATDEVGKILGRFEVRASLQGTKAEFITQKRILDKKGDVEIELGKRFDADKAKLDAQFVLPTTYETYKNKEDFVANYPFVPYQFQLIMKVLDSFVNLNYVDKQVRGNERSLINITYSIAKETRDMEVGQFVSFDKFFGAMFQGSMQHLGQRAIENARKAVEQIKDEDKQEFARRVVNVLFMICNLSDVDKPTFSASIDNVVTLLMDKVDASKAVIKNDVASVLNYLIEKSVIRKTKTESGQEIYEFYTEEESQVAQLISNQQVDSNTYSEELQKIIYNYFGFNASSNKENFGTRTFTVGGNIEGKNILANNGDVVVDFLTSASNTDPSQFAFSNPANHLVFFMAPLMQDNKELRQNFLTYCRVQKFTAIPPVSEERRKTNKIFSERAADLYKKEILPAMQTILDTCPVITGEKVISQQAELGTAKRAERYKKALTIHFEKLYYQANLVVNSQVPKNGNELQTSILRPVEDDLLAKPLSTAEKRVKDFLERQNHDVTVADVIRNFVKVPYGWSDVATIFIVNELVRRHLFAFNYNNDSNVSRETTAHNIVKDSTRFTIEAGKTIPQEVINDFIAAWKHIFNVVQVKGSNDSTELFRACQEAQDSALRGMVRTYRDLSRDVSGYPFGKPVNEALEILERWMTIHDAKEFFTTITEARVSAGSLFDKTKTILAFSRDQFEAFKAVCKFAEDNRDNFAFLPADQQAAVEKLRNIRKDEEPWDNLPSYNKMKRNLGGMLDATRKNLVATITEKWNQMFDELEHYAAEVGVDKSKFASRMSTVMSKTSSSSLHALKANEDTSDFYAEQMAKINAAIPAAPPATPPTPPTPGGDPVPPTTPPAQPVRIRKVVKLQTHTTEPMRSEADVNLYLESLKAQIMMEMTENTDIIIS